MGLHLYFCTSVSVQTKRLAGSSTQLICVSSGIRFRHFFVFLCKITKICENLSLSEKYRTNEHFWVLFLFMCTHHGRFFFWLLVLLRLFWCAHGPVQYHMETVIVVIDLASLRCLGIAPYCHMTGLLLVLEIVLLLVPGYLYLVPLCGGDVSACRAGSCHI